MLGQVNGLDDKTLTRRLYEASAAGVRVDAIVRGICRLRAGVPGISEKVRSAACLFDALIRRPGVDHLLYIPTAL